MKALQGTSPQKEEAWPEANYGKETYKNIQPD